MSEWGKWRGDLWCSREWLIASPLARAAYATAVSYCIARSPMGRIMMAELPVVIPGPTEDALAVADELVGLGLWSETGNGWEITGWAEDQDILPARRKMARQESAQKAAAARWGEDRNQEPSQAVPTPSQTVPDPSETVPDDTPTEPVDNLPEPVDNHAAGMRTVCEADATGMRPVCDPYATAMRGVCEKPRNNAEKQGVEKCDSDASGCQERREYRYINPPTPLAGGSERGDPTFEDFWDAYPRRMKRPAALRAWQATLRRGIPPGRVVEAARAYAADPNLPPLRFVPAPARWLREDAWADGPLPERHPDQATPAPVGVQGPLRHLERFEREELAGIDPDDTAAFLAAKRRARDRALTAEHSPAPT